MLNRRSVRAYAAEPVPEDKLEKILQAGLLAPISKNRKPCEFYVIRDKAVLKELSKAYKPPYNVCTVVFNTYLFGGPVGNFCCCAWP